jgi:hypothetical protein
LGIVACYNHVIFGETEWHRCHDARCGYSKVAAIKFYDLHLHLAFSHLVSRSLSLHRGPYSLVVNVIYRITASRDYSCSVLCPNQGSSAARRAHGSPYAAATRKRLVCRTALAVWPLHERPSAPKRLKRKLHSYVRSTRNVRVCKSDARCISLEIDEDLILHHRVLGRLPAHTGAEGGGEVRQTARRWSSNGRACACACARAYVRVPLWHARGAVWPLRMYVHMCMYMHMYMYM